ncbi:tyrosine kinase family protein [Medicago truncatula]|uniref:Tyrosine kinase family protein n=1 Tax=Medicago truncatula TaxID=3880 RepID=A0A072UMB7_MEDTR|nr:tyrosine kinase family protein [Medicago truncatula]
MPIQGLNKIATLTLDHATSCCDLVPISFCQSSFFVFCKLAIIALFLPSALNKIILILTAGVGSAAMVALLMCIIICCYRGKSSILVKFWFKTKNDINIEAFLKDHGVLLQKRYKFSEIKKITNSFKIKVGQGGFGAVYKGKLFNGSLVAVKILNASKGNGEDFINEVASITRTSHVNVVNLLGFCFEGCNKALIYEFMSNGSLDKFIYNKEPETIASLSWDNMHQIAKGIARGLEYLHRGCALYTRYPSHTRVLRSGKTHTHTQTQSKRGKPVKLSLVRAEKSGHFFQPKSPTHMRLKAERLCCEFDEETTPIKLDAWSKLIPTRPSWRDEASSWHEISNVFQGILLQPSWRDASPSWHDTPDF